MICLSLSSAALKTVRRHSEMPVLPRMGPGSLAQKSLNIHKSPGLHESPKAGLRFFWESCGADTDIEREKAAHRELREASVQSPVCRAGIWHSGEVASWDTCVPHWSIWVQVPAPPSIPATC